MKKVFILLLVSFPLCLSAQKVTGSLAYEFNSDGISIIPAFNADNPAHLLFPSISLGKFSYKPVLAYKANFQQWFNLQRVVFNQPLSKNSTFWMSIGPGLGNQAQDAIISTNGNGILDTAGREVVRYFNATSDFTWIFSGNSSLIATYWYVKGLDHRTIDGHYAQLTYSQQFVFGSLKGQVAPALFVITFDGQNDGLFATANLSLHHKKASYISFKAQFSDPLIANSGKFTWNIGIIFKTP